MGSLRNPKHEKFARARALLVPLIGAAREAGYDQMTAGNAAKLDRRPDIRARIAELAALDEEMIKEKRERIDARLMLAAEADLIRDFGIFETRKVEDQEFKVFVGYDWAAMAESGYAAVVSDVKFDPVTGRPTLVARDRPLDAIAQLRDMHGFKAPAANRVEMTGRDGGPLETADRTPEATVRRLAFVIDEVLSRREPAPADASG